MIVWRGTSRLDGKTPVVVILTGVDTASHNAKTGAMVQAWILVDHAKPADAVRDGRDAAICGDCVHRGDGTGKGRTCYVSLATGLSAVGGALARGVYPTVGLARASRLIEGRQLRIGTYGDPAAVPVAVWRVLLRGVSGWTGYTHQWRRFPALRSICMASVDTAGERAEAKLQGWRTFRVRRVNSAGPEPLREREIVCPASAEGGHRVTCEACGLCRGAGESKDIAIVDHSSQARAGLRRLNVLQGNLFGVSATPDRANGVALAEVFG